MNLTELKQKSAADLIELAQESGVEGMSRARKQDIIFALLKALAKNGESIYGDGVLEILQDGFGFLRSADSSYLAGPDDIYVSPSQIRRFSLRTVTLSLARFARLKMGSVISPSSKLVKSITSHRKMPRTRCRLKI